MLAKTDLVSTLRMLPIQGQDRRWLSFKAQDPETGEFCYFVDKYLPFGVSVSCSHYQHFSNVLKHIIEHITRKQMTVTNYLDDFLFIELMSARCNAMVSMFLDLCNDICVPVLVTKLSGLPRESYSLESCWMEENLAYHCPWTNVVKH